MKSEQSGLFQAWLETLLSIDPCKRNGILAFFKHQYIAKG